MFTTRWGEKKILVDLPKYPNQFHFIIFFQLLSLVIIIEKLFTTGASYFSFEARLSHRNQVWLDHLPECAAKI